MGTQLPHGKGHSTPTFRPMCIVAKRSPISATLLSSWQNSFTGRLSSKFAVTWSITIPSNVKRVSTLPCETLVLKNGRDHEMTEANIYQDLAAQMSCPCLAMLASFGSLIKRRSLCPHQKLTKWLTVCIWSRQEDAAAKRFQRSAIRWWSQLVRLNSTTPDVAGVKVNGSS